MSGRKRDQVAAFPRIHRVPGELRSLPSHYRLVHAVCFDSDDEVDKHFGSLNLDREMFYLQPCHCDRLTWRDRLRWWLEDLPWLFGRAT